MLKSIGFNILKKDPAVYVARDGPNITILAIHIDDTTITGSSPALIESYTQKIKSLFKTTRLGPVHWLLGIEITRDRKN